MRTRPCALSLGLSVVGAPAAAQVALDLSYTRNAGHPKIRRLNALCDRAGY